MNDSLSPDFQTLEDYSLSDLSNPCSLAFASVPCADSESASGFADVAGQTCTVTASALEGVASGIADAVSGTGSQPDLTLAAATTRIIWAVGVSIKGNTIYGVYDVNKGYPKSATLYGGDKWLCWAAASSNMLAAWQRYYETTEYVSTRVPTQAQDIFTGMKANWQNAGAWSTIGNMWWLAGESTHALYKTFAHLKYSSGNGVTGGYYKDYYTPNTVSNAAIRHQIHNFTTKETASQIVAALENGSMVSLAIFKINEENKRYDGHAITLWGVSIDDSTGELTQIKITDSDDLMRLANGTIVPLTGMQTYEVVRDNTYGLYRLDGYSSVAYYITYYETLAAFTGKVVTQDTTAPVITFYSATPSKVSPNNSTLTLKWHLNETSDWTLTLTRLSDNKIFTDSGKNASGNIVCSLKNLPDGSYSYTLAVKDKAGNPSTKTGNVTCNTGSVVTPTNLTATVQDEKKVLLSWTAKQSLSGVTYKLKYWKKGSSEVFTKTNISTNTYTLSLSSEANWEWSVCAVPIGGKEGDWVSGPSFNNDLDGPEISNFRYQLTKSSNGQMSVEFSWRCSEKLHYTLTVDGKDYYVSSTSTSKTIKLGDGKHTYSLTGTTLESGKTVKKSGSLYCDLSVLAAPTGLKASVWQDGTKATLSWNAVQGNVGKANGEVITYALFLQKAGNATYEKTLTGLTGTSITVDLKSEEQWEWMVRAENNLGNNSIYAEESFSNDSTRPELDEVQVTQKKTAEGKSTLTFNWACSESATFVLTLDGTIIYKGKGTSYVKTNVGDGTHSYTLTATDASNNQSSTESGSITCKTIAAVSKPTGLTHKVSQQGRQVTLSWTASQGQDLTYELQYRKVGETSFRTASSTKNTSCTLNLSEDASWEWRVQARSSNGSTSGWTSTQSFCNDLTGPTITLNQPTQQHIGNGQTTATVTWSASEKSTYTLWLDGKQVYTGTGTSYSAKGLADGSHTFRLTATDTSANKNQTSESINFICNTKAAEKPTNLQYSLNASGTQVSFTWDPGQNGAGITYRIGLKVDGSSTYKTYNVSSTQARINLSAEDIWDWCVCAVNSNGTTSGWAYGESFNNDRTAPELTVDEPIMMKSTEGKSEGVLRWSSSEDATYTLWIDGRQVWTGTDTGVYLSDIDDGTYSYKLLATDAAGNTSAAATGSFTCDATAPGAPSSLKVELQGEGSQAIFSWNGVTDKSGVIYQLAYKLTTTDSYTYCRNITAQSFTLNLPAEASWHWFVRAVDGKGNASAWVQGKTFSNNGAPDQPDNLKAYLQRNADVVTFMWDAVQNASGITYELAYRLKGTSTYKTVKLAFPEYSITPPADGTWEWRVRTVDSNGNASAWAQGEEFNNDAPAAPSNLKLDAAQLRLGEQNKAVFSWSGVLDKDGVTYELGIKLGSNSTYQVFSGLTATTVTLTLLAKDESWDWRVRSVDGKGNASEWACAETFTNDFTAPTISIHSFERTKEGEGRSSLFISWSTDEAATYTLTLDGKTVLSGTSTSYQATNLADGTHSYVLTATDAAGNRTPWSGTFFCDATAPTNPTSLKAQVDNKTNNVSFSWSASEDALNSVFYELRYRKQGSSTYTYALDLRKAILSLTAMDEAVWEWQVRAGDDSGNYTSWIQGSSFNTSQPASPENLSIRLEQWGDIAVFNWAAVSDRDGVSYELGIKTQDEMQYQYFNQLSSTELRLELDVTDVWDWCVRAVDGKGYTSDWVYGNTFSNELLDKPANLRVTLLNQGQQAQFSWNPAAGATVYKLGIWQGNQNISFYSTTSTTYTLNLPQEAIWSWCVYSVDANGLESYTSYGASFYNGSTPLKPSDLQVSDEGNDICFSWGGVTGLDTVTYELDIRKKGATQYTTYKGITDPLFTLAKPAEALYEWRVRTVDAANGTSSIWVEGPAFSTDITKPVLQLEPLEFTKANETSTEVSFSWDCSEEATFTMWLDGRQVYQGTEPSCYYTMAHGEHSYELTATDASGNTGRLTGSFTCGATAVEMPTNLTASLLEDEGLVVLSWDGATGNGITYEVGYKVYWNSSYTVHTGITGTNYTMEPPDQNLIEWRVRAVNSQGDASDWEVGDPFDPRYPDIYFTTTAALSPTPDTALAADTPAPPTSGLSLDHELSLSSGAYALPEDSGVACSCQVCTALCELTGQEENKQHSALAATL